MISPLPRRLFLLPLAFAGLLLASGLPSLRAEVRTLTDTQGRTLQADIVSVNGDQVTIKREDGATFTLPLSELSDADQASLKEWAAKHASFPAGSITLSYNRGQAQGGAKSTSKSAAPQWFYAVTVVNHTVNPLADVRVDYAIFQSSIGAKADKKPAPQAGSHKIDSISMRSQTDFTTDPVAVSMSTATKTQPSVPTSTIRGIWLRVYVGDQLVDEACSPDDLSKTETWPGGSTAKPVKKTTKKEAATSSDQ